MRTTLITAAAALVLILVASAFPGVAQEPSRQEPLRDTGLEREVRSLNVTLARLVELLERQLESSSAAVLMQRVQLMTSRIAPLEVELRTARATYEGMQGELDELEISAGSFEALLEGELERGEITAEEARAALDRQMIDQRRRQIEDRLWSAQQTVIDLEQRLDKRRTEIETWEGEIDRALGLR